jgi:hypothetical protein
MAQDSADTERTSVKTYIPAYQREEWERHAEELDMSRSEFVRVMVQVGRRSFDGFVPPAGGDGFGDPIKSEDSPDETGSEDELSDRVVEALAERDTLSWEELLSELTDDIEERLEETLDGLQHENVVQYAGRHGGYTLVEDNGD